MARVAVVLSGCGYLDGAEIQESVITLLALDEAGAEVECLAPDKPQRDVVDHLTGKPVDEARNVLTESAPRYFAHRMPATSPRSHRPFSSATSGRSLSPSVEIIAS